nr:YccF domain-containing protein [Chloroflexia bacterium]
MLIERRAPNLILRVVWFIVVGWWLGGVLSAVAWFFNATIIGLPLGLWIINRLPTFITLRPQEQDLVMDGGVMSYGKEQRPFLL